jgi:hypothetical protein
MIECWSYTRRYPPVFSDPNSSAEYFKPFPKKLWTYYDTGLKGKYRWTTLCVNNMIHYAQESGWEFNFITDENYTKPFTPETAARVEKVFKQI